MKKLLITFFFMSLYPVFSLSGSDSYEIRDLGTLAADMSFPLSINQKGQICGVVDKKGLISNTHELFFWDPEQGLLLLEKNLLTYPTLNDHGQIAFSVLEKGWFSSEAVGFIWDLESGFQRLENPKTWNNVYVCSINNHGEILIMDKPIKACRCNNQSTIAVLKDSQVLDYDYSSVDQGAKINNRSQIAGQYFRYSGLKETSNPIVFDVREGKSTPIFFEDTAYAEGFNDHGQVVGRFYERETKSWKGFFWDPETGIEVFNNFLPVALNNTGLIIGMNDRDQPVLFEKGTLKILSAISSIAPSTRQRWSALVKVIGINDRGEIIGFGKIQDKLHALVLVPAELAYLPIEETNEQDNQDGSTSDTIADDDVPTEDGDEDKSDKEEIPSWDSLDDATFKGDEETPDSEINDRSEDPGENDKSPFSEWGDSEDEDFTTDSFESGDFSSEQEYPDHEEEATQTKHGELPVQDPSDTDTFVENGDSGTEESDREFYLGDEIPSTSSLEPENVSSEEPAAGAESNPVNEDTEIAEEVETANHMLIDDIADQSMTEGHESLF